MEEMRVRLGVKSGCKGWWDGAAPSLAPFDLNQRKEEKGDFSWSQNKREEKGKRGNE